MTLLGRLEEWVDGYTLKPHHFQQGDLQQAMARTLAVLHATPLALAAGIDLCCDNGVGWRAFVYACVFHVPGPLLWHTSRWSMAFDCLRVCLWACGGVRCFWVRQWVPSRVDVATCRGRCCGRFHSQTGAPMLKDEVGGGVSGRLCVCACATRVLRVCVTRVPQGVVC